MNLMSGSPDGQANRVLCAMPDLRRAMRMAHANISSVVNPLGPCLPLNVPRFSPCCTADNPRGGTRGASLDARLPDQTKPRKVTKGGSHLCAPNYCRRY